MSRAEVKIRPMTPNDYRSVRDLWAKEPGITLTEADNESAVRKILELAPGISLVAEFKGHIIGSVMGTQDVRRGYIHHLVVEPDFRAQGLGAELMRKIEAGFKEAGIEKLHLFIMSDNHKVQKFYEKGGWHTRPDIILMSKSLK